MEGAAADNVQKARRGEPLRLEKIWGVCGYSNRNMGEQDT